MDTTALTADHAATLHLPKTSAAGTNEASATAGSSHAEVDGAAEEIYRAVERLVAKAAAMADGVIDISVDSHSPHVASFHNSVNSAWAESARNKVREHPLAAVGIALMMGLMIGRL